MYILISSGGHLFAESGAGQSGARLARSNGGRPPIAVPMAMAMAVATAIANGAPTPTPTRVSSCRRQSGLLGGREASVKRLTPNESSCLLHCPVRAFGGPSCANTISQWVAIREREMGQANWISPSNVCV